MNYINRLQSTIIDNETMLLKLKDELSDFACHLQSTKFHDDTTIQTKDVLRFIDRLYNIINDREF